MTRVGIYVQVPFCQTKCTYCNFHTGVFSKELYAPYVRAVCREIAEFPRLLQENGIAHVPDAVVDTVYFGGGTPSLLEPESLAEIIEAIRANIAEDLELPLTRVNVKAKTNEKLGYLGRKEGIEAQAAVLLMRTGIDA